MRKRDFYPAVKVSLKSLDFRTARTNSGRLDERAPPISRGVELLPFDVFIIPQPRRFCNSQYDKKLT